MKQRLTAIKSMIRDGTGIIDVGTDHGYLPIDLVKSGYSGKVIASDINPLPLETARSNAKKQGIDSIEFRLSDGLSGCKPAEVDTIVIAGMGGDLICRIIDEAEWTMDGKYDIIVQPMTKAEILRFWLISNGYSITEETHVFESGKLYSIIRIQFTGIIESWKDSYLFVGKNPNKELILFALNSLSKKPKSHFYDNIISELKEIYDDIR